MKLLLAEDEKSLSRALAAILERNHFSVDTVFDGEEALYYAEMGEYDGIILDIMMPKLDGFKVLKALKMRGDDTPVLILTARNEIDDLVTGLDLGADDYLTKPFDMKELLARVRALTRKRRDQAGSVLCFGHITLDRASFRLSSPTGSVVLPNKEFQILELLMSSPGRLVSTKTFLEKFWGYNSDADISVVWVYISYLRKKLKSIDADVVIKATRNAGYTLEEKK